jgi:hypothetical protein
MRCPVRTGTGTFFGRQSNRLTGNNDESVLSCLVVPAIARGRRGGQRNGEH